MKKVKIYAIIVTVFSMMVSIVSAERPPLIWAAKTNRDYYSIGGDRISLGVMKLTVDDWRDKDNIDYQVSRAPKMNFLWDDKWYYETLPDSKNELLVLFWKNHDANKHGWLAIKNTPDTWYYTTDLRNHSWKGIKNDEKINMYWEGFGTRNTGDAGGSLSIDVKNPENKDGWTPNDIWVGFGK